MDSNGSPVSPRRSSCAKTSPIRAFAPGRRPSRSLVGERADPGVDAPAARELDDVLDVPERPQDEDVRGAVDPGVFGDRGAPARDAALDGRAALALEPVDRVLAVRLDEGRRRWRAQGGCSRSCRAPV